MKRSHVSPEIARAIDPTSLRNTNLRNTNLADTSLVNTRLAAAEQTAILGRGNVERKNFGALTGLRFFAAIAVVFYHFSDDLIASSGPRAVAHIVDSGFAAVSFFFVLSGFVLSYSYVDRGGAVKGSRRAFWAARFARIYPAYFLAFLIAAPYHVHWALRVNQLHAAVLKLGAGAVAVLSLQQAWTPWTAWYWNFPAWSVSVEAFFYLAFPFVALKLKKFNIRACFIGMAVLWLLALLVPVTLCLTRGVVPVIGDRIQMAVEYTPLLRLPEFLIGLLLGRAYVLGFRFPPAAAKAIGFLSAVALLACLAYGPAIPRPVLANGLLAPLFALLIYSLAEGQGWLARGLSLPFLVLLGEASYGIYILQIPVSYVFRVPPPHHSFATFGLYLIALIGTALLSWRFVESPLRGRIRQWLLKPRAKQANKQDTSRPRSINLASVETR